MAHLPSGGVVLSGQVVDATGAPLPNNKVLLQRDFRYIDTSTDAAGQYSFPGVAPASYDLRAALHGCRFLPRRADLDDLNASLVENFGGFGAACGGALMVNAGAMTGPFTISGHLRDAAGLPILGGRIDLIGRDGLQHRLLAVRFTDFTGSYSFNYGPHDYQLRVSGSCVFTPSHVHGEDLHASVVRDFVGGPGCQTVSMTNPSPTGTVFTVSKGGVVLGTTYVRIEVRASTSDAMARLAQIAAEQPGTPSKSLTIDGNPAIERQTLVKLQGPDPDFRGDTGIDPGPFMVLTTAIVVGNTVVRFESQLAANADAATVALFLQSGRNFTAAELPALHGPPRTPVPTVRNAPGPAPPVSGISTPGEVPGTNGNFGELEVAASDLANAVVYGTQTGPFFSTNGGQTITASTYNTANPPPATTFISLGDPTVAVGAPSSATQQTIYFAQLEQAAPKPAATATAPAGNLQIVAAALYQSNDNGQTFNSVSFPVNCSVAAAGCVVPDWEKIATDRLTRAVTPTGSADQIYMTWRNFTSQTTNAHTLAVACSKDGGQTWTTDLTTLATTGGDNPRPSVGPDGSLLVSYEVSSGATYSLQVQKWSSCASGFTPGILGTVNKAVTEVTDMPGIDRQAVANYAVAFDDSDGSGQRVFAVYSNEATTGNDDIHAAESLDGGATWPRDSIISTSSTNRRYFPWVCSTVGKKFVTWYDRRDSTAAKPDLTAYYRSTVFDNASPTGVGAGTETNVSGVDDPQCASGFPSLVRGVVEEAGCKNLPAGVVQGGTCQTATCAAGKTPPCGTLAACDFRAAKPCATAGEACATGNGQPKFGDYNGAGCALGTLYMAWASSTAPKGGACLLNGVASAKASACCSGQAVGGFCSASAAACTGNGGACGAGLQTCCSSGGGSGGLCQAGTCLPAISIYSSSSCIGPACAGLPVTITYHQVGGCNGYATGSGAISSGPNAAFVVFDIESIDNSGGTANFSFDPGNVFVPQTTPASLDSGLSIYADIFGPFAITPLTINAGQNLGVNGFGAAVVQTTAADGATETDHTVYPLHYNRAASDPLVILVNSQPGVVTWPLTQDCKAIVLK
ncbi:MAG TPA: carboxypeptidase-like regulatory domain-containing protein [Acidisarcina sp.]